MYRTGTRLPKYRYIIKLIPKLTYCYLARQLIAGIFFTEVWSQKEHNSTWFYLLFKYDMPNLRFVCRYFQKLTQIQRYRNPVAHWGSLRHCVQYRYVVFLPASLVLGRHPSLPWHASSWTAWPWSWCWVSPPASAAGCLAAACCSETPRHQERCWYGPAEHSNKKTELSIFIRSASAVEKKFVMTEHRNLWKDCKK